MRKLFEEHDIGNFHINLSILIEKRSGKAIKNKMTFIVRFLKKFPDRGYLKEYYEIMSMVIQNELCFRRIK